MGHQVYLIARVNPCKPINTGLCWWRRRITNAISIDVKRAISIADSDRVQLSDAVVHIVTNSICVEVCFTGSSAFADGIELRAVAIAIACQPYLEGPTTTGKHKGTQIRTVAQTDTAVPTTSTPSRRRRASPTGTKVSPW